MIQAPKNCMIPHLSHFTKDNPGGSTIDRKAQTQSGIHKKHFDKNQRFQGEGSGTEDEKLELRTTEPNGLLTNAMLHSDVHTLQTVLPLNIGYVTYEDSAH